MKVIKTSISDVVILEPRVFGDERGYFFESFSQREFNEQVAEVTFVQDNESKSSYGVVRGLHYQLPPLHSGEISPCGGRRSTGCCRGSTEKFGYFWKTCGRSLVW